MITFDIEEEITPPRVVFSMQPGAALLRGEVTPASYIPAIAKERNAVIVENNLEPTRLTYPSPSHPEGLGRNISSTCFRSF
jgi:hypothetical protein